MVFVILQSCSILSSLASESLTISTFQAIDRGREKWKGSNFCLKGCNPALVPITVFTSVGRNHTMATSSCMRDWEL